MFLHLSVILFTGDGLCPSMHHKSNDQGGSLSSEVSVRETPQTGTSPYGKERAVRIPLECILVLSTEIRCYLTSPHLIPNLMMLTLRVCCDRFKQLLASTSKLYGLQAKLFVIHNRYIVTLLSLTMSFIMLNCDLLPFIIV